MKKRNPWLDFIHLIWQMGASFTRRHNQLARFILPYLFSNLISLVSIGLLSEQDLEILLLRRQLAILERKQDKPVRPNRTEKLTLAVLTAKLKQVTQQPTSELGAVIRIFQPETVLNWHRELVRRKWHQKQQSKGGRPRISQELEDLIVQMAQENRRWGYGKIKGELSKLGFSVSEPTVRNVLSELAVFLHFPDVI